MQRVVVTVPIPYRGMTNDARDRTPGVARRVTGYDVVTDQGRAVPYRDSEDSNSNAATDLMQNWAVALRTGTTYSLYALARQDAAAKVRVLYKNLTTGASTDLDDNGWTETNNNTATTNTITMGGEDCNLFYFYKKTGLIYGGHASRYIYEYDPTGSAAFSETKYDLTSYSHLTQAITHSQDDVMYFGADNKVIKNDNGTFSVGLTLPSQYYVASVCEYGENIAVSCAPLSGIGRSRLFIWNRRSTLNTVNATVDLGEGNATFVEEQDGYLVCGLYQTDTTRHQYRMTFRYWYTGASGAKRFEEFTGTDGNWVLRRSKQKTHDRVYFMMSAKLNGTQLDGVWSISRSGDGFSVVHERTPNNDTAISAGPIRNFFFVGDYLFQAYVNASSDHAVSKTNDQSSYTASAIVETVVNPRMPEQYLKDVKRLVAVGAMYRSLPTAGQAVVKARVDAADGASYTTIFTETTDAATYTEPRVKPSGGTHLSAGKDLEFQIISTGGAEPTHLIYVFEVEESKAS